MDTQQFLDHILPSGGPYYIVYTSDGDKRQNHVVESKHALTERIKWLEKKGQQVWHANASFASAGIPTGEFREDGSEKLKKRSQDNVAKVRSFWIDLDCGEGKPYATQRDAIFALVKFCKAVDLPVPLIVNSGYGIHAYWVTDADIPVALWTRCAYGLRDILTYHGIHHDPACTADSARVLRPVGSLNRKREPFKAVAVVGGVPARVSAREFFAKIGALVKTIPVSVASRAVIDGSSVPAHLRGAGNSDLMSEVPNYPVNADEIADRCRQIEWIASNPEQVNEPLWRGMLGIVKFCEQPEEFAHAWSEGHNGYDPVATIEKMEAWGGKPTTCAYFEMHRPGGCKGCKHSGSMVSPIKLGISLPKSEIVEEVREQVREATGIEIPDLPDCVTAAGFAWGKDGIKRKKEVAGKPTVAHVAYSVMWPTGQRVAMEGGGAMIDWVAVNQQTGEQCTFSIPGSVASSGADKLAGLIGTQGITLGPGGGSDMHAYIHTWMKEMARRRATYTVTQFGWQKDGSFVLGHKRYMPDGEVVPAGVTGNALALADEFGEKGELADWVDMVDTVYNQPGQEQYQFMVGAGFGAPLMHLMQQVDGVTLSAWSPRGGLGKSTAAEIALSIYGNPAKLRMERQQATINAMLDRIGVLNSLPVMLDEMTNIKPHELSSLLYAISSGAAKARLTQTGAASKTSQPWCTVALFTGNRSVIGNVSSEKTLASGEMCRVFDYEMVQTSPLDVNTAKDVLRQREFYGTAGDVYVRYLVANQEQIKKQLRSTQRFVDSRLNVASADRFISVLVTTTLVGLTIANKLGLCAFDVTALFKWIGNTHGRLTERVSEVSQDGYAAFGTMLASMQNNLLVTNIEGDLRRQVTAQIERQPRGEKVSGRQIVKFGKLYLSQPAILEWCTRTQTDAEEMKRALKQAGILLGITKYTLGKGVTGWSLPPTTCWIIDTAKMTGEEIPEADVKPLQAVR